MATVRKMEMRDVGKAAELMEDLAARGKFLGADFFSEDYTDRQNGFYDTLVMGLKNPEGSLSLVGEHNGEVVMVFVAHLHNNYPYAKHKVGVYIPVLWFKEISKIVAGRIIVKGTNIFFDFLKEKETNYFFGNTFHADDRARKLMRRLKLKATYIRYEGEI
jgi:hypothetical protein